MHSPRSLGSLALLASLAVASTHAQVFLSLSPASVIGGSPVFLDEQYNNGAYAAGNIFNQQTGPVDMTLQRDNAWFPFEYAGEGLVNRFVTIDLGVPTVLASITIFNSNATDRGTWHFSLAGANAVEGGTTDHGHDVGSVLSSPTTLLASTPLTYSTANPVTGQAFAIADLTPYRYLQILLIDGQSQDPTYGMALSEVRVAAVPEPSEYAVVMGAGLLGFMVWRCRMNR